MKKSLLISILFLFTLVLWAQQDVQYTQYMQNMSIINPAYTIGNTGTINIGILHRSQWVGVVGTPKSSSLFGQASINNKVEVGLSFINDNIGDIVKENNIAANYAYKLDLGRENVLSLGLRVGVNFLDIDFSNFNLESGNASTDPDFSNNVHKTFLNFGIGAYYNTQTYYVGFSVPNLLKPKHLKPEIMGSKGVEEIHYLLTGGYVFEISDQFKLKPSALLKGVKGAPLSFDFNLNALYNENFEFGIGYRIEDAIAGMVNYKILPELKIGYAYGYTLSKLNTFSNGSHEIFITYNLNTLFNGFDKSPRFF